MFGIEDHGVALAYVLCLASSVLCVIYASLSWNRGDDSVEEEGKRWAAEENHVEENM